MNEKSPRVSVIIPTYNQADLLRKALESVISQTFTDWEAIVIDNHSTDGTQTLVESIGDQRIRYATFSNHGVIAASRNYGIGLAAGTIIAFLDSDDLWYPTKLSVCLEKIDQGADAIAHGFWIRKNGIHETEIRPQPATEAFYWTLLFQGNSWIATSTAMIKSECFRKFGRFSEDPAMVTAEDYELWLRFAKHGVSWNIIPDVLGEYTVHRKNASRNVEIQMRAEENIVIKYYHDGTPRRIQEKWYYWKRRFTIVLKACVRLWQSGNRSASIPCFLKGLLRA